MSKRYHTEIIYGGILASGSSRWRRMCAKLCIAAMLHLYVADGFLAEDECLACIWAMDAGVPDEAEVLGGDAEPRFDVRRAEDIDVDRAVLALVEDRLDQYRGRVARHFGAGAHGTGKASGFVRYLPGGFYTPHVDWTESAAWPAAARRRVAAVVFLGHVDDGRSGGDFEGGVAASLSRRARGRSRGRGAATRHAGRVSGDAAPRGDCGATRRSRRDRRLVLLRGLQSQSRSLVSGLWSSVFGPVDFASGSGHANETGRGIVRCARRVRCGGRAAAGGGRWRLSAAH